MKKSVQRIVCGALALAMASSLVLEGIIRISADGEKSSANLAATRTSFTDVTGQFDTSKMVQQNFNNSVMKTEDVAPQYETRTVLVTLSEKPLIERAKGEAVATYLDSWSGSQALVDIGAEQTSFLQTLYRSGISYELVQTYNTVINGVALRVNTEHLSFIREIHNVQNAFSTGKYSVPETVKSAKTTNEDGVITNQTSVYDTGIYDSSAYAEQYGEGTVVAILDTGLDYTHKAFQDFEHDDVDVAWSKSDVKEMVENRGLSAEKRSGSLDVNDVYISEKVPFAYDYADDDADVYPSFSNHGTHVAGIIGGYDTSGYTDKDGNPIDETFKGVVPDAQLVICKVFTDDLDDEDLGGAVPEDIIAALDDCVKLGVDVINMSLGTSCGFTTPNDEVWEGITLANVYERIQDAGITLVCAASNDYSSGYGGVYGTNLTSNPDSGTVGSPSTFSAAFSVASINGQKASYFVANEGEDQSFVFYEESRDIDGNPFDFVEELSRRYNKTEFEYVVVGGVNSYGLGGVGIVSDYRNVQDKFADSTTPRIALVARGDNTFKEKVEVAQKMGAAAIVIYNNVSGTIRMNLGEIENPIPAISIGMNAGIQLVKAAGSDRVGRLKVGEEYAAGPFMSEFSSWGPTHDLKLKPEITAHGGEITSTVPGGYGEQSGTSMASPNMAGFMALVRSYIKNDLGVTDTKEINRLAMQLTMSTAGMVNDQDGLPYSPRKQGAGVARLENVISNTKAYLFTDVAENDYRPKIELGDDPNKTGVYEMSFKIRNFGTEELTFTPACVAMTESASVDGLTVSEQAYLLDRATIVWTEGVADGKVVVGAGEEKTISVTLTLDEKEKAYMDRIFENGIYVEGFLQLKAENAGQCDLGLPFLGFYGDWADAPMLDYSAFEIAENESDPAILEEDKIKASVWATLPYTAYYNDDYVLPMGGYVYLVDENDEPMYVSEEHCAVSRYNEYYGEGSNQNYLSSTSIRAVYTGLLRNACVVKYEMYNDVTGEFIYRDTLRNVAKAYSGGGNGVPANVELRLSPEEMGLTAGATYRMNFEFFKTVEEAENAAAEENTFTFSFTVDYDAPVLENANVRYYNYKENDKDKQRIYLDLDIFDNHYPQAVMLCYPTLDAKGEKVLQLATEYPTPIRDAVRNGTSKVSIEITDIYEKYGKDFYVQVDDYALNSCLYKIDIQSAKASTLPDKFELAAGEEEITLDIYQTHKVALNYTGSADLSNFSWKSSAPWIADVKDGLIVGLQEGVAEVAVRNPNGETRVITVNVTETISSNLPVLPSISFGIMQTSLMSLTKAQGSVPVFAGKSFKLTIEKDPWYHPLTDLRFVWSSSNPAVATVDQEGNVQTLKKGNATIEAMMQRKDGDKWIETTTASVTLQVQEEFTVSNYVLTDYNGVGWNEEIDINGDGKLEKVLVVPTDMNIWYIGAGAFEDNDNVEYIVIPDSVIDIREYAFMNCSALRGVYFSNIEHREENGKVVNPDIDWAALTMVYEDAFYGCKNLEFVDLSNVKTITVAHRAFMECISLKQVIDMPSIGTMHHYAFANTALTEVDLTGLHMSGKNVFEGCENITDVKTGKFTAIGDYMFTGCLGLTEITLSTPKIGKGAFASCYGLSKVTLDSKGENFAFAIGERAFEKCGTDGFEILFNGEKVRTIGDRAFMGTGLTTLDFNVSGLEVLGDRIFANTQISSITISDGIDLESLQKEGAPFTGLTVNVAENSAKYVKEEGVIYNANKTKILFVDSDKTDAFILSDNVQEIASYAFANSQIQSLTLGKGLEVLGEYVFYNSAIAQVDFANNDKLTQIPAGAFYGSNVENVILTNHITALGDYAFAQSKLSSLTADGLTALGDGVFESCKFLQTITLADGITKMGNGVFENCAALTSVTLPSVKELGSYTFSGANALQSVTFGANATTAGAYTFYNTPVTTVNFNNAPITTIEEGAFYGANKLQSITLPNTVQEIGFAAFYNAYKLRKINLENVVTVADYAFYNNAIVSLDLQSAKRVGVFAFGVQLESGEDVAGACTSLKIPVVEEIGAFAFLNNSISTLEIPASLRKLDMGAFGSAGKLATITAAENPMFFVEDNVLYRNVSDGKYELVLYPAAREAEGNKNAKTYTVKEGTISVLAYAIYGINKDGLDKVVLPYSLRFIGDSAFFASGVTDYEFKSIQAPKLGTEYRQWIDAAIKEQANDSTTKSTYKGFYYNNFEGYFYDYTVYGGQKSKMIIRYPENGVGYDNYVYGTYFGVKYTTGLAMEENTHIFATFVDAIDLEELNAWLSWDTTDEDKKTKLMAYSEELRIARVYCNNARESATQAVYVTEERLEKLENAEKLIRDIKGNFGIFVGVSELKIASYATYKNEYREGEVFDGTGLKALLVYQDGSQTELDVSELSLDEKYLQPLKATTQYVRYTYGSQSLIVRIKVNANETPSGGDEDGSSKDETTGCGSEIGVSVTALGLLGLVVLFKKKKREN